MKRAWISLVAFVALMTLAYTNARSACEGVVISGYTVPFSYGSLAWTDASPDTFTVGLGQPVVFHASLSDTGSSLGSGCFYTLAWAELAPTGSWHSVTKSVVDSADVDTDYSWTWSSTQIGQYKLTPFVTHVVATPPGVFIYSSTDTVVVNVKNLWHHGNLRYEGAVRIRKLNTTPNPHSMMAGGGRGLTYNPDGNAGADTSLYLPGSLFISGHEGEGTTNGAGGYIGEIAIPKPVIDPGQNVSNLPMAEFIQDLQDATGGLYQNYPHGDGARRSFGDLCLVPGTPARLFWSVRQLYNGPNHDIPSIGRVRTTLSNSHPEGLWHIGPTGEGIEDWPTHMSCTSDYMFLAPSDWASQYTSGRTMISGMGDREDGTNGACQGSGMYAWNPGVQDDLPNGAEIQTTMIAWYKTKPLPAGNVCDSCGTAGVSVRALPGYSAEDEWTDGCWLTHGGRQAVAMFGNKARYCSFYHQVPPDCHGLCCTWDGGLCGQGAAGWVTGQAGIPGYSNPGKIGMVYFYDPDLLGQAALGAINPWDVHPYDTASLQPWVYEPTECTAEVQGVAYDPEHGRVFAVEFNKDHLQSSNGDCPILQVYRFDALSEYVTSLTARPQSYALVGDTVPVVIDWELTSAAGCTVSGDTDFDHIYLVVDGAVVASSGPTAPPIILNWTAAGVGSHTIRATLNNPGTCTIDVESADAGVYVEAP